MFAWILAALLPHSAALARHAPAAQPPGESVMPLYGEAWQAFYGAGNLAQMLRADCISILADSSGTNATAMAFAPVATIRLAIDDNRYRVWKDAVRASFASNGFDKAEVNIEDPNATTIAGKAYEFTPGDMMAIADFEKRIPRRIAQLSVKVTAMDASGAVAASWSLPASSFGRPGGRFPLPFSGLNRLSDIPSSALDWRARGSIAAVPEYATSEIRLDGLAPDFAITELQCHVEDAAEDVESAKTPVEKLLDAMVEVPESGFSLCRHETTQELWEDIMGGNPSHCRNPENPVEMVSVPDIDEFLRRLNGRKEVADRGIRFRLPSESEWETACRAGGTNEFGNVSDGNPGSPSVVSWNKENSGGIPHAVGGKVPNAWGFFDMHGNVREWTSSRQGFFQAIRGGGWDDQPARCSATRRILFIPEIRNYDLGFRLAY